MSFTKTIRYQKAQTAMLGFFFLLPSQGLILCSKTSII